MISARPVALVTGSRVGLGKHISQRLTKQGFRVVGCSRGLADWTDADYQHVVTDVSDEKQVKLLMREIASTFGRLDVVINNAGIAAMNHSLLTPVNTVDRLFSVNVRG